MQSGATLWPSPETHLARANPRGPVLYFCPDTLQRTARRFLDGFPGLVTYAVKANDGPEVLENLVAAGIAAFDVASPAEMAQVRAAFPGAVLHYHNPVRAPEEVAAGKTHGVVSWSVDCAAELDKLMPLPDGAEVAVRLRLPVAGAAYDFGAKFGADPEVAAALLAEVARRGLTPSLTFHPGTQCADPEAWAAYIFSAAEVARRAGVTLHRLNVGGGFAAHRDADAPDLEAIFARIGAACAAAFGASAPALVCEPGRAVAAEAFTLALPVKAVRPDGALFLGDGIYGALAELRDIAAPGRFRLLDAAARPRTGAPVPRVVFGPTCDSLDRLPEPLPLPGDVAEGDWLVLPAMGAYSAALSTRFNGYGALDRVTVAAPARQG
ncbi:type III PLP-dependent enzyme [Rhodosalinus sp. K401]|uniref:type III PLP-dependent enzyme n=1 Tax=Rhodosalinus sp. K401 TaxID=3239195 RepID=UPI0035244881